MTRVSLLAWRRAKTVEKKRRRQFGGFIWEWDHLRSCSVGELEYWDRHVLPWGWSVISDRRKAS
jgi:hypothetical protein